MPNIVLITLIKESWVDLKKKPKKNPFPIKNVLLKPKQIFYKFF
jgi:hypothetical protein